MPTLPPTPSYNANVPVVTSGGGTSAAYKDPNSPESIMKKTTLVNAQAAVDTSYDVDHSTVSEGYKGFKMGGRGTDKKYIPFFFIVILLYIVFSSGKSFKPYAKVFLSILAGVLIIITIFRKQNGTS